MRASNDVAGLFRRLQHTVGLNYFGVYWGHAASVCAFNVMEFLPQVGVSETFHVLTVVLCNISRRWVLVRGVVKLIWVTLTERKLDSYLNAATLSLFKLNAVDNWDPQDHKLFELCAYPNYAAISERGRDFVGMGDLLQEYAGLTLDETAKGPSADET